MFPNPNKRTIPSNFVIPKKQKKAEQPSYSNVEELLQTVNVNDNRFHMEVGRHFLENLFDPNLKGHVRFTEAKRVVNNDLYKKFLSRQQKLTRLDRPHDISYGFLLLDADTSELEFICSRGYASGYSFCGDLGNAKHGVYLSRYSDLCTPSPFFAGVPLRILIFKILPGRSKPVGLSSFNAPADQYFDSHVPRVPQQIRTIARHDQFRFSQIFLYEYDERGELVDFPTGVYPFAFVLVNITPPEPQLVTLKSRLDRDSVVWTGLLAFKNETLDRVEMIASHADNVMKPRGLESKIEIQMLIPWSDCLNYSPISKLLTADNAGGLVRNPEIVVQDKNGLLQCASYFTIVQNNSPLFYRVHNAMRNEHVAAISFINGTLMVLIPNGEFSSLLSLPRHDKPVFHCIFLSYKSFITSSTNLEIETTEEEMFKHVPFKGEKVDGNNEQVHSKIERAHATLFRFQPPTHLGTTSLIPNRMPPQRFPYPPPGMNVPPPGFMPVVTTNNAPILPMLVPPPPPLSAPKPKEITVRPESASPPTVEMPDASPRESESPIPDIEKPEEKNKKEGSPKEVGEKAKPNYLQQAMMNIRQLDQEKKSASRSPQDDAVAVKEATTSRDNVKSIPPVQVLRDPRVRKLFESDPEFLQKIVDITAPAKKIESSPKSSPKEPVETTSKPNEEEEISRPYSPSDALTDISDDIEIGDKAISSTDETPQVVSQISSKEEVPSYVSSSTSSYIPPSGRSILGAKSVPTKLESPLTSSFLATQSTSEKVDFNFTTWRGTTSRRDSAMSPLGLQIDEAEDNDESTAEATVSSTTVIPESTQIVEKEDEIAEPTEPQSLQSPTLTTEPKVIPLDSSEETASSQLMGDSWRKGVPPSNDFDFRDVYIPPQPQISPSSNSAFVLPDFSVPPPILSAAQPIMPPALPDLTKPPPFAARPRMHIPPPPQMFAIRSGSSQRFPVKHEQPTTSTRSLGHDVRKHTELHPRRGERRFDRPPTNEKEKTSFVQGRSAHQTSTGRGQLTQQIEKRGLVRNIIILVDPQLIIQDQLDINEFQRILEAMRDVNAVDKSFNWHIRYHRHIEERLPNIDDKYADLIIEFEQNGVIERMAPHFCDESKVKNPYSGAMICAMTVKRAAVKENPATWVIFMTALDPSSESGVQFRKNEIDLQTPTQVADYCTKMVASVTDTQP